MSCGSFNSSITSIVDGQNVSASVVNTPLNQLLTNDTYLKCVLDATAAANTLVLYGAAIKSDLLVGQAAYWNTATNRFEKALSNASGKRLITGMCLNVLSSTVGNILIAGYATLDLTNAGLGATPAAGMYALDTSVAGHLVLVGDSSGLANTVVVLLADGSGHIYVQPQYNTAFHRMVSVTGNSVDGYTNLLTEAISTGYPRTAIVVTGTIKNTGGANGLTVKETVTDAFGVTDNLATNVAFGGSYAINTENSFTTARPPYTAYAIDVKSQGAGNATAYNLKCAVNRV
jgi:hypothetical protein